MEEISALHNLNLEWGCITNLVDRITAIEDKIDGGWQELIDMVADAMTEESENKDPASAFFNLYQFLFRLYYRLKTNPEKSAFNRYSKHDDKYWITNYDYKVLKWAHEKGFTNEVDNLVIKIPADKLNDSQKRAFDRKCERGD